MRKAAGTAVVLLIILAAAAGGAVTSADPERREMRPPSVPEEEYPVYDAVVRSKFLTSETALVLIDRLTVARTTEDERVYLSRDFFEEQNVFGGLLPTALLDDFFFKLAATSRLEARFGFGVRYRFFSDGVPEEPEVSWAPIPATWGLERMQAAPEIIGILRFSRAGFTPPEDQALVYVEEERPDGTGGGLLVWLFRRGALWSVAETEVLWVARTDEPGEESP
jgi:hypothetical protein